MALGVSYGSGGGDDIVPIIKYNAKAGMFTRNDRVNVNGTWVKEEHDITTGFKAVFDMENVEVGWMNFDTGGAPDFRLVPIGGDPGQSPGEKYKMGFRVMAKLAGPVGGDIREFCSCAGVVMGAFDALHDAYLAGVKEHSGQLPVVTLAGKKGVKSQYGTNFEPQLTITQWVTRPADLVFKPKAKAGARTGSNGGGGLGQSGVDSNSSGPPATGSTKVSAPQAAQSEDFG